MRSPIELKGILITGGNSNIIFSTANSKIQIQNMIMRCLVKSYWPHRQAERKTWKDKQHVLGIIHLLLEHHKLEPKHRSANKLKDR